MTIDLPNHGTTAISGTTKESDTSCAVCVVCVAVDGG